MDLNFLLPIVLPTLVAFFAGIFGRPFFTNILDSKYLAIAIRVIEVLDPILADNTKAYGESGVRLIIQEVILAVTDKRLSQEEISRIIDLTLKLFNPAIAANSHETKQSQVVLEAIAQTGGNLSQLDLSGIRWKFPIS